MGMSFLKQDRPGKVKEIYRALKRDHPGMPAEMKARISARQGKPGSQKQGPPYKGPITPWKEKTSMIPWDSYYDEMQKISGLPRAVRLGGGGRIGHVMREKARFGRLLANPKSLTGVADLHTPAERQRLREWGQLAKGSITHGQTKFVGTEGIAGPLTALLAAQRKGKAGSLKLVGSRKLQATRDRAAKTERERRRRAAAQAPAPRRADDVPSVGGRKPQPLPKHLRAGFSQPTWRDPSQRMGRKFRAAGPQSRDLPSDWRRNPVW